MKNKLIKEWDEWESDEIKPIKNISKLEMESVLTNFVEYFDFDKFVRSIYDKSYDFCSTQEANNDTDYTFKSDGKIGEWDKVSADNIRNGKIGNYKNYLLFNCLVADGYLEPGTYVVRVSW